MPLLSTTTISIEIQSVSSNSSSIVNPERVFVLQGQEESNDAASISLHAAEKKLLPSKVEIVQNNVWVDLPKKLDEYINFIKEENKIFSLFSRKELNTGNLIKVREMTSILETLWEALDNTSENIIEKEGPEYFMKQLDEVEKTKRVSWQEKMEFYLAKEFSHMCKRGLSILLTYIVSAIYMSVHLRKNPPNLSFSPVAWVISFSICQLIICSICNRLTWPDGKLAKYSYFFYIIDASIILPLTSILAYQIKNFLCNPLGLVVPFWHYFTMKSFLHFTGNPEYKAFIQLIEKEKRVIIEISETKKRVNELSILLENEQRLPKGIGGIIASFLDRGLALQEVYSNHLDRFERVYYDKVQDLAITEIREVSEYQDLNRSKKMSIGFLALLMVMGGIYFAFSLFSVIRFLKDPQIF